MRETKLGICPICGSCCGLVVEVDGGRITKISGDKKDPHSRGYVCPKGRSLKYQHTDPDRVLEPLKKVGDDWEPVEWDSALDDIASRIVDVQKRYGKNSLAVYAGDGCVHSNETIFSIVALVGALGIKNLFTPNSMDTLPRQLASYFLYGSSSVTPIPDVKRTDYLLIIGGNPVVSNGSVMTAPGFGRYIRNIQKRGGKVIVVDPRKSETAEISDEHHFIRPETDVVLLMALINIVFRDRRDNPGHLKTHIKGYKTLEGYSRDFTPQFAQDITGIPATEIERLAAEFSTASSAVCYGRMGTCAQSFGTTTSMLIDVLNIITGNFDRHGGAMFPTPVIDLSSLMRAFGGGGSYAKNRTSVEGLPGFNGELPCVALADEIEAPDGIRALIVIGGNPAISVPDSARLTRAFSNLELMVSLDPHVNATSSLAHYILPPAIGLEHEMFPFFSYGAAIHNTIKWTPPVIDAPASVKHDGEIIGEVIRRVLAIKSGAPKLVGGGLEKFSRQIQLNEFLKLLVAIGPYGNIGGGLKRRRKPLTFEEIQNNPHGMYLGLLEPRLQKMLGRRGRINFDPAMLEPELRRAQEFGRQLAAEPKPASDAPLKLISRRQLRFFNTCLHNIKTLATGPEQCTLQMNPKDAEARKIKTGDVVAIQGEGGESEVELEVTGSIMTGVVSLPFGWNGPQPAARQKVSSEFPGMSVNTITSHERIDPISAMTAFNGTEVIVKKR